MSASRTIPFFYWVSARKLVRDFSSAPAEPALPTFTQGTVEQTEQHFGEWDGRTQRWHYVTPPPGFRFAVGSVDARPEAGTWTISDGVNTTPGIAYDADAAAVEVALATATPAAIEGWTVTKPGTARWMFTATAPEPRVLLTVSAAGLAPSSFADVYALQEGTATVAEIQEVELFANPAGYQDVWDALPAAAATVEVIAAGGGGANAQQRIVFDPVPVGGSYVLTMPNGAQTPVLDAYASEAAILEAIQQVAAYAEDGDVAVSGAAVLGEITISFQGTLAGTAQAQMSVRVDSLQVPVGLKGEVDFRTAAAKKLVRGQSGQVSTTLEARALEGGSPTVLEQRTVYLRNGLIETTTQQAPAARALLNAETGVVNGNALGITELSGVGSEYLSAIPTAALTSARIAITTLTTEGVWELTGGTDVEEVPYVIRPNDFHLDNNAQVWRLVRVDPAAVVANAGAIVQALGAALPFVSVAKNGDLALNSPGVWTKVTGWTVTADSGGAWANDEFVAPAAGVYDFAASVMHDATNGEPFFVALWKWDGSAFALWRYLAWDQSGLISSGVRREELAAGDRVALYVRQSTAGPLNVYADAATAGTSLTIKLLP